MDVEERIRAIQEVIDLQTEREEAYFHLLNCVSDIRNYWDYMLTEPINCDEELQRVASADYNLCTALLQMLLREDHFSNGSFARRYRNGQIQPILERMIYVLKNEMDK